MKNILFITLFVYANWVEACPLNLSFDSVCRGDRPYDIVLPECIARAEKGDAKHITILANYLRPSDGHGDIEESRKWFLKAIDKNYAPAMYYYATATMRAYPIGKETAHAKLMLYKGAELGEPNAIAQLGYELGAGRGEFKGERDLAKSLSLLLEAAHKKSETAQHLLVSKYKTQKNYIEAFSWNYVVKRGDVDHRSFKNIVKYMTSMEIQKGKARGVEYKAKYGYEACL